MKGAELGGGVEGEVREAVGAGGAAVMVFVRWRGERNVSRSGLLWGVRRTGSRQPPLPLPRRRGWGPATNGFALLGGWHVDPVRQMARAGEMNANSFAWLAASAQPFMKASPSVTLLS